MPARHAPFNQQFQSAVKTNCSLLVLILSALLGLGTQLARAQYNEALGTGALQSNTSGNFNVALGDIALFSNTSGNFNTATGYAVLYNNTTGFANTASGYGALLANR